MGDMHYVITDFRPNWMLFTRKCEVCSEILLTGPTAISFIQCLLDLVWNCNCERPSHIQLSHCNLKSMVEFWESTLYCWELQRAQKAQIKYQVKSLDSTLCLEETCEALGPLRLPYRSNVPYCKLAETLAHRPVQIFRVVEETFYL